jgi:alpha-N-arabinofuranosidase
VLDECYDDVDLISLHCYYANRENDTPEFLAKSDELEEYITGVIAACDYIKAKKHRRKKIMLSVDEWNVWYHSSEKDRLCKPWEEAPRLLEDEYNFEDALLVGSLLITLLRHADRVKVACLAQLVNVIAPIFTSDEGSFRQPTFYPYAQASTYGRGRALNTIVRAPVFNSKHRGDVGLVDAIVIENSENELTLFAVNKDLEEDIEISCDLRQYEGLTVKEHTVLTNDDMKAVNTFEQPFNVAPQKGSGAKLDGGRLTATLGRHSWNVIRLAK